MHLVRHVLLFALLLPSIASAANWGGFNSARVNYAGGVIFNGSAHSTFRARLAAQGDVAVAPTSTLTSAYLAGVDVFYTSLSNLSASPLSVSEQSAISDFVANGGVFIISADIFNTALYNSEGLPFGITGFSSGGSTTASPTGAGMSHPLMTGIFTLQGTSPVNWNSGPSGTVLAANGSKFVEVYDGTSGFAGTGAVLVLADHNFLTDSFIASANNQQFLDNVIGWASALPNSNAAPVANAGGPYTGTKNVAIALNGGGSSDSDGSVVSWLWDCDNDGVVDVTDATGTGSTCTYPTVGTYTLALTVTDNDGSTGATTATVTVGNDAPIASAGGPYLADEGVAVTLSAAGSSDPGGSIVSYSWDCDTDGVAEQAGASATVSCTYPNQGAYTATLVVTDDDGATALATAAVTTSNVAPLITSVAVPNGDEGDTLSFAAAATDVPADTVTYTWDFGDGGSATGAAATYAYPDDGSFSVVLTATDSEGGTSTSGGIAVIANVAPTFSSVSAPSPLLEGSSGAFSAVASDVGSGDVPDLIITWNWNDGTVDSTGASVTHTFANDGIFTVVTTVIDQDGGSLSQSSTVVVSNVAPIITTTPSTAAAQGTLYTYTPAALEPGSDTLIWTLGPAASSNLSFSNATGATSWTPDSADTAQGTFAMELTVLDGDGGSDVQSWTITVTPADTDGDGLTDDWETANGLNPNDPNDATGDPDFDGLSNLDEFLGGSDPFVYDGPTVPVLVSPIAAVQVGFNTPDLVVANATDPQSESLIYTFEVYEDPGLTTLIASNAAVAEDGSGQTSWTVDVTLTENATYYWRAAASDAAVTSAFSFAEAFQVNETNEAPGEPELIYPIEGEVVSITLPTPEWLGATDPDSQVLTYDIEVYEDGGALVTSAVGVPDSGSITTSWPLDVLLADDANYQWTVRASDGAATSSWTPLESFFVSTENGAPSQPFFIAPVDGDSVVELSPLLVVSESEDPEGGAVSYFFELDSDGSFISLDYQSTTITPVVPGDVTWDLAESGLTLNENELAYARVRATDEDGISSAPDTIEFFVRGDNDAPSVPELSLPADMTSAEEPRPTLVVIDPTDPENDPTRVEFRVGRDAEMTEILTSSSPINTGAGTVTWTVDLPLTGTVFWTARAVDDGEQPSEWATPWSYTVREPAGDDDDSAGDDDDDDDVGGCDCESSVGGGSSAWAVLLLPLIGWRRRR